MAISAVKAILPPSSLFNSDRIKSSIRNDLAGGDSFLVTRQNDLKAGCRRFRLFFMGRQNDVGNARQRGVMLA
jgi:hypothetical protein